jgi:NADPH:quinone reductase-like Zn-dependent oxidoreductase
VTPGAEISGTVVATGSSAAAREWMGKEVWADVTGLDGAFAEYCACPAALLAPKPSTLSHAEATALPVAGSTSLQALRQVGLSAGEAVLVLGGSTGCGAVGIQIAKALGAATVCTTASAPTHSVRCEAAPLLSSLSTPLALSLSPPPPPLLYLPPSTTLSFPPAPSLLL